MTATLTGREHQAMLNARDDIKKALVAEQKLRSERTGFVEGKFGAECEWVVAEQECVLREVNKIRSIRGLEPVDLELIQQVEQMAVGHSDYTPKFCLYASEIAFGVWRGNR